MAYTDCMPSRSPVRAEAYARVSTLVTDAVPELLAANTGERHLLTRELTEGVAAVLKDPVLSQRDVGAVLRHVIRRTSDAFQLGGVGSHPWKVSSAAGGTRAQVVERLAWDSSIPQSAADYIAREALSVWRGSSRVWYVSFDCSVFMLLGLSNRGLSPTVFRESMPLLLPPLDDERVLSRVLARQRTLEILLSHPNCPEGVIRSAVETSTDPTVHHAVMMNPSTPVDVAVTSALLYPPSEVSASAKYRDRRYAEQIGRHTHFL